MTLRETAMMWAVKAGTVFGFVAPRVHLPDDFLRDMRHTKRTRQAVFQAAERIADGISDQQRNDPKLSELQETAAKSTSSVEQLIRDMRRNRS